MPTSPHILQVSEFTKKVRFLLESEMNTVWLSGEISNFVNASSGHWYLSLKDEKSQVRCAMFKGNNRRVTLRPTNGQQVLVRAKVSLYEPRGDFQLIIEHMEDGGEGLLRQKFEQLKNKLNNAGWFDLHHKKAISADKIKTIGVVTSPTGAAIKDIIAVLKRRNPAIKLIIYPALVQGEQATADIVNAIKLANKRNECDALIVGRGGGSLEDLWSFNEEKVVQAIFESQLPIVSAVGHEIDTTLADYVADMRAATPSAAAELISDDIGNLAYKLQTTTQKLTKYLAYQVEKNSYRYHQLKQRLLHLDPKQTLMMQSQKADDLQLRLTQAMKNKLLSVKNRPLLLQQRLDAHSPAQKIRLEQDKIQRLTTQLASLSNNQLAVKQQQFVNVIEQLHIVSPLATIARGYSITRNDKQQVIKQVSDVAIGDTITTQLTDGVIHSQVTSK